MNRPRRKRVVIKADKKYETIKLNPVSNPKLKKNFVFVSYSHANTYPYLKEFRSVIKPIEEIGIWIDERIKSGEEWNPEVMKAMKACKVAVALISHSFLSSNYIVNVELPYLLKSAQEKKISLLNVLITYCKIDKFGLDKFQFVNAVNKPMDSIPKSKRIFHWKVLADRIEEIYNEKSQPQS